LLLNPQVRAWVYFLNVQIPRGTQQRHRERRINFTTETQRTRRRQNIGQGSDALYESPIAPYQSGPALLCGLCYLPVKFSVFSVSSVSLW
jgi:hypothetical protein